MASFRSTAKSNILILKALAFEYSGNIEAALKCMSQAIVYDPDNIGAYCRRGLMYANRGDKQSALDDYQHVLHKDPGYGDIRLLHGCLSLCDERFTGGRVDSVIYISSDLSDPRPIWLEALYIESR